MKLAGIVLIAVLSFGLLLLIDNQSAIVGKSVSSYSSYVSCCTIGRLLSAPNGLVQTSEFTRSAQCLSSETPENCCSRFGANSAQTSNDGLFLLDYSLGACASPPEVNYPAQIHASTFSACCTTETWQNAPTGINQGEAKTTTEQCVYPETINQCCLRSVSKKSALPINLLGAREGACSQSSPQLSYPVWVG